MRLTHSLPRRPLLGVMALAAAAPSFAQLPDVAIVAAASASLTDCRYTDPQSYLLATGQFGSVDVIDCTSTTPSLADLTPYDAVLTWSNTNYNDPVALGDTMADYVDQGGAVVVTVFANTTTGSARYLQGRWITGGYEIIQAAQGNVNSAASLGAVLVPGHPIMAGVNSLSASSAFRPLPTTMILQGTRIADWDDGAPLAIAGDTPGRVDLGLYPPPSTCSGAFWDISTDGDILIANAITFAISNGGATVGTNYCTAVPNASGSIGVITGQGSDVAALNNLTLRATDVTPNQFGIFICSRTSGFSPGANGSSNGNLCLGGVIGRINRPGQILPSGPMGEFELLLDLTMLPQGGGFQSAVAGDTWFFQGWHREGIGNGSNFTDGLEVSFN